MAEIAYHVITATCADCPDLTVSAGYPIHDDGTTDHETTGLLATVKAQHVARHPGHTFSYRIETPAEAERRVADARAEEEAAIRESAVLRDRKPHRPPVTITWPF